MYDSSCSIVKRDSIYLKESRIKRSTLFYVASLVVALLCWLTYVTTYDELGCLAWMALSLVLCVSGTVTKQFQEMIIASNIKDYKATIKEDGLTATLGIVNINGDESSIVLSKYYNYTYSAYNKRLHIVHDSVVIRDMYNSTDNYYADITIKFAEDIYHMLKKMGYDITVK